jgi:hypothetical protein
MLQASTRSPWNWEFTAAVQLLLEAGVRALIELVIRLAGRPRPAPPSARHAREAGSLERKAPSASIECVNPSSRPTGTCHLAAPQAEQGDRACDLTDKDKHPVARQPAPRIVTSSGPAVAAIRMTCDVCSTTFATGTPLPRLTG